MNRGGGGAGVHYCFFSHLNVGTVSALQMLYGAKFYDSGIGFVGILMCIFRQIYILCSKTFSARNLAKQFVGQRRIIATQMFTCVFWTSLL